MKRIALMTTILAGLLPATTALSAPCADRETVAGRLESIYSEQLTAGGLQTSRTKTAMVEVWTSPESGTFTVIITNPQGISCVVAAGTDWFQSEPVQKVEGIDG